MSEDFGDTWLRRSETPGVRVLLPSRYPQSDPTVFAGTGAGLLRSRDAGKSFERTSLFGATIHRIEWPGPALVVACDQRRARQHRRGRQLHRARRGPAARAGARARAVVVLRRGPGDVRGAFVGRRVPLVATGAGPGAPRASRATRSATSSGSGPSCTRRASAGFHRSEDAGVSWTRLSASSRARPRACCSRSRRARALEAFLVHRAGAVPHAGRRRALAARGLRRPGRADRRDLPARPTRSSARKRRR